MGKIFNLENYVMQFLFAEKYEVMQILLVEKTRCGKIVIS
jgi:hypothetical protein